jgi:hypothetical protein
VRQNPLYDSSTDADANAAAAAHAGPYSFNSLGACSDLVSKPAMVVQGCCHCGVGVWAGRTGNYGDRR